MTLWTRIFDAGLQGARMLCLLLGVYTVLTTGDHANGAWALATSAMLHGWWLERRLKRVLP